MKKTFRQLAMCSMRMHYKHLVVICDFQPMRAALSGCHLMFDTKDVAILLKYLIDTRIKILQRLWIDKKWLDDYCMLSLLVQVREI